MENRAEFDLENNIKNWKVNLTKKNNLTKTNIIELENHLFDSIDDLKFKGLNEEEAFIIARKRLGKIDDICLEFDKVNINFSIFNTVIPYLKGALIYIAFIVLSKLFLITSIFFVDRLNINNSTFNIISIILLISISVSFFSLISFNIKKEKSFLTKLNKINVLVSLIIISLVTIVFITISLIGGIDLSSKIEHIDRIKTYSIMEYNFAIYKAFIGFILLASSLILFWDNKKQNKLKFVK